MDVYVTLTVSRGDLVVRVGEMVMQSCQVLTSLCVVSIRCSQMVYSTCVVLTQWCLVLMSLCVVSVLYYSPLYNTTIDLVSRL